MLTWVPCTTVCNRHKPDILHTCSQHGHTPIDFYAKHSRKLNLWAKVFLMAILQVWSTQCTEKGKMFSKPQLPSSRNLICKSHLLWKLQRVRKNKDMTQALCCKTFQSYFKMHWSQFNYQIHDHFSRSRRAIQKSTAAVTAEKFWKLV